MARAWRGLERACGEGGSKLIFATHPAEVMPHHTRNEEGERRLDMLRVIKSDVDGGDFSLFDSLLFIP